MPLSSIGLQTDRKLFYSWSELSSFGAMKICHANGREILLQWTWGMSRVISSLTLLPCVRHLPRFRSSARDPRGRRLRVW